ncbi:MAG: hypothetical protein WBO10_02725 [Pyrinomonadaceae bacterium]
MQVTCPHCGRSHDANPNVTAIPSDEELKILELLDGVSEMADGPTAEAIAHYTNMPVTRVRFLLGEIEERGLIGNVLNLDEGSEYHIRKEGRRVLHS